MSHTFDLQVNLHVQPCKYIGVDGAEHDGVFGYASFLGKTVLEYVYDVEGECVEEAIAVRLDDPPW